MRFQLFGKRHSLLADGKKSSYDCVFVSKSTFQFDYLSGHAYRVPYTRLPSYPKPKVGHHDRTFYLFLHGAVYDDLLSRFWYVTFSRGLESSVALDLFLTQKLDF